LKLSGRELSSAVAILAIAAFRKSERPPCPAEAPCEVT
jgi:hypothetical protein